MKRPADSPFRAGAVKVGYSLLLLTSLLTLTACGVSLRVPYAQDALYPEYKAYNHNPSCYPCLGGQYGYHDIAVDSETYFISYMTYFRNGLLPTSYFPTRVKMDASNERLLKGAQEHALYRAAELTKSKGKKYFAILYKDDWNLIREWSASKDTTHGRQFSEYPDYDPGAGIVIRLLHQYPSTLQSIDDRVYEVDTLLQQLPEKNHGLAEYSKQAPRYELSDNLTGFRRWRSFVKEYESLDAFEAKYRALYRTEHRSAWSSTSTIESTVVPQSVSGSFEFSISDRRLISPLRFLHECVRLADEKGYEVFEVVDWTVEEHRVKRNHGLRYAWFLMKATIVLQHQKKSDDVSSIFVVDEIRKNVEIGRVWP